MAYITARRHGLVTTQRDIFLDHDINEAIIDRQFQRLIKRAHDQGYAIGIGHPYKETLNVLEKHLPLLEEYGVELVHVSTLLNFDTESVLAKHP